MCIFSPLMFCLKTKAKPCSTKLFLLNTELSETFPHELPDVDAVPCRPVVDHVVPVSKLVKNVSTILGYLEARNVYVVY